jgi:hypothetical protein
MLAGAKNCDTTRTDEASTTVMASDHVVLVCLARAPVVVRATGSREVKENIVWKAVNRGKVQVEVMRLSVLRFTFLYDEPPAPRSESTYAPGPAKVGNAWSLIGLTVAKPPAREMLGKIRPTWHRTYRS